jgi:hypothetical protein
MIPAPLLRGRTARSVLLQVERAPSGELIGPAMTRLSITHGRLFDAPSRAARRS